MKIQNSIKAAVAAFLIGAASQAAATTISINASGLPATNPLTSGTYQGSFNGSAVLPGNFIINSIGFSFTFADDSGDPFTNVIGATTYETTTSTGTQGSNRTFTTTTIAVTPVTSTGQSESVLLSFGGVNYSGQTTAGTTTTSSNTVYGTPVKGDDVYVKNGAICTDYAITHDSSCKLSASYTVSAIRTDTTSTDYTGNIALADSLLSYDNLLASLLSNKSLDFTLGITGDINLTSASLNVDYTETPEPGSLALFGIALLGAAGVRRARRG